METNNFEDNGNTSNFFFNGNNDYDDDDDDEHILPPAPVLPRQPKPLAQWATKCGIKL